MEYLLKGLVKSFANDDSAIPIELYQPGDKIKPIGHIPFCVACNAHVVTSQDELQILWKDEYKALTLHVSQIDWSKYWDCSECCFG